MIKSIMAGSGLAVANGSHSYPYINMNNASAGMVRYNGNTQNFEVYDGNTWMVMYSAATTVTLDYDVQSILNWAREKMQEEQRIAELAKSNPTIADALAGVKRAQEQVQIVTALMQDFFPGRSI